MKIERTDRIVFDQEQHAYAVKETGRILTPVSSVLDSLEPPFDAEGKSIGIAKREALAKRSLTEMPVNDRDLYYEIEEEIKERASQLREQWEAIGAESMDFGDWVDGAIMNSIAGPMEGEIPAELDPVIYHINQEHGHYYKEFGQFIVFSEELGICGTMDRLSLRGPRSEVIDITDYKTGINKGMTYDGGKVKDGVHKYFTKFYLEPLAHLEVCSYIRYAMQLSSYAYLMEKNYGARIGRLKICFIHRHADPVLGGEDRIWFSHENIPVPYMRRDVEVLFERIRITKEMMGMT